MNAESRPEILLPYWRSFVTVEEIPGLIASALYPQDQLTISRLRKTNGTVDQALTEQDWRLLCSLTPPYRDGMSELEFRAVEGALRAIGADLYLVPYCVGGSDAWAMACAEHDERLKAAILGGTVPVCRVMPGGMLASPWLVPTRGLPANEQDQILVPNFQRYAANLGIRVRVHGEVTNRLMVVAEAVSIRADVMAREARALPSESRLRLFTDLLAGNPREAGEVIQAQALERELLEDVQRLADAEAIWPRTDILGTLAPRGHVDSAWYLTLQDLDKLVHYNQRHDPHRKEQYLQELIGYYTSGRYTLCQAAELIAIEGSEKYEDVLERLKKAALKDELPMYAPSRNLRLDYGPLPRDPDCVRDFYEQTHWDELNAWLDAHAPRVTYRFPHLPSLSALQDVAKHKSAADAEPATTPKRTRSVVAPLIERAINAAGSAEFPGVLLKLRELALNSEAPFTGEITDDGFVYTDGNNNVRTFTKDALGSYLSRRRKQA